MNNRYRRAALRELQMLADRIHTPEERGTEERDAKLRQIPVLSPNAPVVTLSEFAGACEDAQLAAELERLQEALVSSVDGWKGSELLNALQSVRRKISKQKTVQSKIHLAPLNP